jgi:hypothetical protein
MSACPTVVNGAVEGNLDAAVLEAIVHHLGGVVGSIYGRKGKSWIHEKIQGYNSAAKRSVWFVLVDLDEDFECAPKLVRDWLSAPSSLMCFRVAVKEVEAWLLADRTNFAQFLQVPAAIVPRNPEIELNPKETIINLARRSRSKTLQLDLVPRAGSHRDTGPGYVDHLSRFALSRWNIRTASSSSRSLRRAVNALSQAMTTINSCASLPRIQSS